MTILMSATSAHEVERHESQTKLLARLDAAKLAIARLPPDSRVSWVAIDTQQSPTLHFFEKDFFRLFTGRTVDRQGNDLVVEDEFARYATWAFKLPGADIPKTYEIPPLAAAEPVSGTRD